MWSSSTSLSDTTDESSGDESKVIFDYPRQPPSYENLKDNIYLQPVQLSKASKKAKKMVCECVYDPDTDEDGGCGEDCLNRLLMIECNPKCCPCGEFCMNQRFQKGQYPKLEVFDARRKGFGLRVLEDVPMGAFVIEYLGEVCTDKEFRNRTKMYAKARLKHHYFMKLKGNEIIDATKKGNESRFINHSCDPSCETQKWTVAGVLRVGFFAIKHMKTGDEVTFDYKFQRYGRHDQKCFCGSANCRGVIGVPPKNSAENQSAKVVEPKTKVIPDKSIGTKLPPKRRKRRKKHIVLVSDSQEETDADAEVEPLSSEQPCEENFEEDLTSFQKDLLELIGTEKNLSKDSSIVDFLRLTFSAETLDERITLLSILQATEEQYCLQQFLKRRGLKLLHDWLSDMTDLPFKFKLELLKTLNHLPISVKNTVTETHILPVVEEWADSLIGEIPEITMTSEEEVQLVLDLQSKDTNVTSNKCSIPAKNEDKESPVAAVATSTCHSSPGIAEPRPKGNIIKAGDTVTCTTDKSNAEQQRESVNAGNLPENSDLPLTVEQPTDKGKPTSSMSNIGNEETVSADNSAESALQKGVETDTSSYCKEELSDVNTSQDEVTSTEDCKTEQSAITPISENSNFDIKGELKGLIQSLVMRVGADNEGKSSNTTGDETTAVETTCILSISSRARDELSNAARTGSAGNKLQARNDVDSVTGKEQSQENSNTEHNGNQRTENSGLKEMDVALAEEAAKQAVYVLASKLLTKWNQLEEKYRIPKKMAKPLTPFRRHTVDTTTEESPGESPSPRPSYCSDDEHYSRRNKRSRFHNFESFKNQEDFTSQFYSRNTGQRNKRQSRWSRRFHSQDSDQLQYGQSKNPRREKRRYYDSQDNDSYRKRKYNQQQIQYQSMYESQCEPQFSSSFSGSTSQENVDISLTDLQGETLEDSLQQDLQQQETTSEQQLMLQQPHMEMPQKNFQVLIPQEQLQQQQLIQSQQQMQQHQFMQQQPNVSQPLLPVFQTQPIVAVNQPNNIIAPAQPVQSQLLSGLPQLQTIQSLAEFQSQFMRAKTQRPPLLTQPNAFQVPNVPPPPGPGIGIGTIPSQPGISFVPQVPHRMPLPTASSMGGVRFLPPTISAMNPVLGGFMTNPFSVPPPMPLKSQQSTTIPATISTLPVPVSSASIASVATSKIDNQSESMQLVGSDSDSAGEKSQSPPPPPLPSHWRSASDADGRTYYYHVKNRVSQWEFPTEAPGSTSDAKQKQRDEDNAATGFSTTPVTSHEVTSTSDAQQKAYNITPDANAALETWQMALMEESSLVKKKESSLSEKDATSKAKEAFRNKVSQVVVQCLNQHYRPDCSRGRIETSEDFKHLAKKLTYGIMEKHTRNIKQGFMPEFTSGTKSKIHDYVKTYMKKYGEVYRRN